jgi:uncharacterized protein (TIGR00156 family)
MKARYLPFFIAPFLSTATLAGGYTGPGGAVVDTVAVANKASDDSAVILDGVIIKKLNNDDKYEFRDGTGTIIVDIDDEDLPVMAFNENTRVKLTGEVDKGWFQREIEVDRLDVIE